MRDAFYSRVPEARGKRVILYLGRIHPQKGVDLLLKGFAATLKLWPDFHLVIAGSAPDGLKNKLMELAKNLSISQAVSFPGMLEGVTKWGAFYNADVFALCSHGESFGVSVVEALSCGCPVLISDKVNIWREIEKDGVGLVATDSAEGAERLLTSWGELDDESKSRMRVAALDCFQRNFEITRCVEKLLNILIPGEIPGGDTLEEKN